MEEKKICQDCGRIIEENETCLYYRDEPLCEECYEDNYCICDECGEIILVSDSQYKNDWVYCEECFNNNFSKCDRCGEYEPVDDMHDISNGQVVCDYCYREYYVTCNSCGDIIDIDDSVYDDYEQEYYCRDCYNSDRAINDYYYKPEPIFYGDNDNMFMGIELEIDGAGEDRENADELLTIDGYSRIYCKHDGSLDDGFEIVSHPCTLEYHCNNMEWQKIMEKSINMGYRSHDARTCGLHIHISKKALGRDYEEIDKTIGNILYFVEKFWDKMLKLSRRTQDQLDQWASRYGLTEGEKPKDMLDKAKSNGNRYKAINLLPSNTIEFRLYRGTLKYNTFIATLQLTKHIAQISGYLSHEEMELITWSDFVESIKNEEYTELLQYLEDRKIMEEF